jgi:hypothetical protein
MSNAPSPLLDREALAKGIGVAGRPNIGDRDEENTDNV